MISIYNKSKERIRWNKSWVSQERRGRLIRIRTRPAMSFPVGWWMDVFRWRSWREGSIRANWWRARVRWNSRREEAAFCVDRARRTPESLSWWIDSNGRFRWRVARQIRHLYPARLSVLLHAGEIVQFQLQRRCLPSPAFVKRMAHQVSLRSKNLCNLA